jgi:hypothetical protein
MPWGHVTTRRTLAWPSYGDVGRGVASGLASPELLDSPVSASPRGCGAIDGDARPPMFTHHPALPWPSFKAHCPGPADQPGEPGNSSWARVATDALFCE